MLLIALWCLMLKYVIWTNWACTLLYVVLWASLQGLIPHTLCACLMKLSHLTPHIILSISPIFLLCLSFICYRRRQLTWGNSPDPGPTSLHLWVVLRVTEKLLFSCVCIRLHEENPCDHLKDKKVMLRNGWIDMATRVVTGSIWV